MIIYHPHGGKEHGRDFAKPFRYFPIFILQGVGNAKEKRHQRQPERQENRLASRLPRSRDSVWS